MSGRPLLAASLAFVGGVAIGAWLPQEPAAWGWAALSTLVLWGALCAAGQLGAGTLAALAAFAIIGIFRIQSDLAPLYAGVEHLEEGDAVASGRIARPGEPREGGLVLHLENVRLRRDGETIRLALPLQIFVSGECPGYMVGDLVTARGRVRTIRGDRNLGWFPGPVVPRGRRCSVRVVVAASVWLRRDGHDPGRGPGAFVLRWRAAADAFWKNHPGAAGQILNSLTTGERAGIPEEIQESFLRSGLTHLLAISGMNVAFLAALVFLLLSRALALWQWLALRFPVQPVAAVITLPSLWFFMLFSGSQIPVGRAVLSSAAGLAAVILWRRVRPADAWGLAALSLVAWDPASLFSASFQLSFAAVGGLLLVASRESASPMSPQPGERLLPRLYRGARSLFVVSIGASAATAPLVAFHFQQMSLVGPLANLVAVPFTGFVVLPAGWLALVAAAIWGPPGEHVATVAIWSSERLVDIASWFATPAWAVLRTARPPLLPTLCLLVLTVTLLPRPTQAWLWARAAACACAAVAFTWSAIATHRPEMLVTVLDVGQGLAVVVRLPGGGSLLYDAGPRWRDYDAGERIVAPALRRLGIEHLDTMAISHAHPDHAGGAAAVRREMGAGMVWGGVGARSLGRGMERTLDGDVRVRVLNPPGIVAGAATGPGDENDRSLALLLNLGETGVVFTGDAGPSTIAGLIAAARPLPAHLALQVPHHGGSAEACKALAELMRPEVSVISVGRNTYGHPRPGAVAALEESGRVLRTDRDGAAFIRSDGCGFVVRTWLELASARTWPERVRWLVAGW